jgi:hypothetical protein
MDEIDEALAASDPQRCGTCRFADVTVVETVRWNMDTQQSEPFTYVNAWCHRYPVAVPHQLRDRDGNITESFTVIQFPTTDPNEWCGEWDARALS